MMNLIASFLFGFIGFSIGLKVSLLGQAALVIAATVIFRSVWRETWMRREEIKVLLFIGMMLGDVFFYFNYYEPARGSTLSRAFTWFFTP